MEIYRYKYLYRYEKKNLKLIYFNLFCIMILFYKILIIDTILELILYNNIQLKFNYLFIERK